MKSTILAVSMTLLFSVFSVSAIPQGPLTSAVDSPISSESIATPSSLSTVFTSKLISSVVPTAASFPVSAFITTPTIITSTPSAVTSSTSTSTVTSALAPSSAAALPMAMRADGIAAGIFAGIMAVIVL